jgi:hypothetical protein
MVNISGFPKDRPMLSKEDSAFFHDSYIELFVDTNSSSFQKFMVPLLTSEKKAVYGYLWNCLRNPIKITHQRLCVELSRFDDVLVMADEYDQERSAYPIWPFPPRSVVQFAPQILLNALTVLPEDLYIFDRTMDWTLVQTHEYDDKRRYCLAVGIAA